jgi:hypothetical protein
MSRLLPGEAGTSSAEDASPTGRPQEHVAAASSSSSRRRSLTTGLIVAGVLVLTGGVLFAAGVFEGHGAPAAADPAATPAPTASATAGETPGETIGTPENPFRPGDSFTFFDDWTFTVGETDTDAWPGLAPYYEEHFADEIYQHEPGPGMVYVTVPLSMAYTGGPSKQRHTMMAITHVSADGVETRAGMCGLAGGDFRVFDNMAVQRDPVVEGSLCAELLPTQVPGGQWWIYLSYWDPATGTELDQQFFYTAD